MRCKEAKWGSGVSVVAKGNKIQLPEYNQSVDHHTRAITCYIPVDENVELDIVCRIGDPPIFGYRLDLYVDGIMRGHRSEFWGSRREKDFSTGPVYLTPAYGLNELDDVQCSLLKSERIRSADSGHSATRSSETILKPGCIEVQLFLRESSDEPETYHGAELELVPLDLGQNLKSTPSERVGSKASLCVSFTPSAYKGSIPVDSLVKNKRFGGRGRKAQPWATFRFLYRTAGRSSRIANSSMWC